MKNNNGKGGQRRGSKSEVVENRAEFWMVFALPNFRGAGPKKVVPKLSCPRHGTSRGKVSCGYYP